MEIKRYLEFDAKHNEVSLDYIGKLSTVAADIKDGTISLVVKDGEIVGVTCKEKIRY